MGEQRFMNRALRWMRSAGAMRRPRIWFLSHWPILAACAPLLLGPALLLCWPSGCTPRNLREAPSPTEPVIRVRLAAAADQLSIEAAQAPLYFTSQDPSPKELGLPRDLKLSIRLQNGVWVVGQTSIGAGELTIRPIASGSVRFAGVAYRGEFRLLPAADGRFDLVNVLGVEDYLSGVLSRELLSGWHQEAYRAQAIAARTYALYQKLAPRETPRAWDVNADTSSQVYGGMDAETARSVDGAAATRGIVLVHGPEGQEKIFQAYYSSCCGGITQSSADAFTEPLQTPLTEQYVGPLCSASPRFTWGPVVVDKDELTRRFRAWRSLRYPMIKDIATIRSIEIERSNRFGRPVGYLLTDVRGAQFRLTSEELRWGVNSGRPAPGTTLLSGFVESIINESDQVRFLRGHGSGHGVGLCQWCTEARARAGMRHEDIVLAAYPGAQLRRAY